MIYLSIAFFFGVLGALVGRSKGSSGVVWFFISAIAPGIGLVAALCMSSEREELRRECPNCGRIVKLTSQLCPCGEELYFPEEAIESRADAERRGAPA